MIGTHLSHSGRQSVVMDDRTGRIAVWGFPPIAKYTIDGAPDVRWGTDIRWDT